MERDTLRADAIDVLLKMQTMLTHLDAAEATLASWDAVDARNALDLASGLRKNTNVAFTMVDQALAPHSHRRRVNAAAAEAYRTALAIHDRWQDDTRSELEALAVHCSHPRTFNTRKAAVDQRGVDLRQNIQELHGQADAEETTRALRRALRRCDDLTRSAQQAAVARRWDAAHELLNAAEDVLTEHEPLAADAVAPTRRCRNDHDQLADTIESIRERGTELVERCHPNSPAATHLVAAAESMRRAAEDLSTGNHDGARGHIGGAEEHLSAADTADKDAPTALQLSLPQPRAAQDPAAAPDTAEGAAPGTTLSRSTVEVTRAVDAILQRLSRHRGAPTQEGPTK